MSLCDTDFIQQQQLSELSAAISSTAYLADVATGVAAVWRSEGVLQKWRAASGYATASIGCAAAATQTTHGAVGAASSSASASPGVAAAAGRRQQSTKRLTDQQLVGQALGEVQIAMRCSFFAAINQSMLHL